MAEPVHPPQCRTFGSLCPTALINTPSPAWLHDPQAFAVNRLDARSAHRSTAPARASTAPGVASLAPCVPRLPYRCCIRSGRRPFHPVPPPSRTQGLWPPAYVNIQMPWDGHEDPPGRPSNCRVCVCRRFFQPGQAVAQTLDAAACECPSTASRRPSTSGWTARSSARGRLPASEFVTERCRANETRHRRRVLQSSPAPHGWRMRTRGATACSARCPWWRCPQRMWRPSRRVQTTTRRPEYTLTVAAHIEAPSARRSPRAERPRQAIVWPRRTRERPASQPGAKLADVQ